jgi:ACT domain-containing protein
MIHTSNLIITHKAGLLNLVEELDNVYRACKVMGVSRDTFYRYQNLLKKAGWMPWLTRTEEVPMLRTESMKQ